MAAIAKPKTWAVGESVVNTDLNNDFDTIYNDYNGNITDANIAAAAAIAAIKISGTALVSSGAGTQSPTKRTMWSAGSHAHDTTATNRQAYAAAAYNAGTNTLALKPGFRYHYLSVNDATAYDIRKITDDGTATFTAGDQIVLIAKQAGAGSVTLTDQSATADAANLVHGIRGANHVVATTKRGVLGVLTFGDPVVSGFNMWWAEG